jgi:hypothetical protein
MQKIVASKEVGRRFYVLIWKRSWTVHRPYSKVESLTSYEVIEKNYSRLEVSLHLEGPATGQLDQGFP